MKNFTTKAIMLIIALIASFQFSAKAQNAFAYDISASATSDPSVARVIYIYPISNNCAVLSHNTHKIT